MTTHSEIHVKFHNVDKTYDGENLIVDNLNLNVEQGEFATMLGPSGSGKTTCLMMLAGFETVTNGEIYIHGKPISSTPPNKRNIGLVFQNYALFPHMTVKENLAFPLQVRKYNKQKISEQIEKALSMVRLEEFGSRKISQLSGGQKQRIAVARALVFEPDLILMDEPLGALDKNLREEMQYEIKHLHEALKKTFIYVTHDQSEAITMSDKIAVFNQGKIQQYSNPSLIYEQPKNYFVANFIGENNVFRGKVESATDDECKVVLANKQVITALPIQISSETQQAIVSVRPEKITLNPPLNEEGYNYLEAKIQEIIYLGDHLRIYFSSQNDDQIVAKIPNSSDTATFSPGDTMTLGWPHSFSRAFDESIS